MGRRDGNKQQRKLRQKGRAKKAISTRKSPHNVHAPKPAKP